uniref:C2H2-type domain-containing protein n=1 Tax=Strongyloides venezuelensis TaxID=75913 RepID=A0A0K0FDK7_STRVS
MSKNSLFYCFICDKRITTNENKFYHFEEHVDYEPFRCLDCNSRFKGEARLEEHLISSKHFNYSRTASLDFQKFITFMETYSSQVEDLTEENLSNRIVVLPQVNDGNIVDKEIKKCTKKGGDSNFKTSEENK